MQRSYKTELVLSEGSPRARLELGRQGVGRPGEDGADHFDIGRKRLRRLYRPVGAHQQQHFPRNGLRRPHIHAKALPVHEDSQHR